MALCGLFIMKGLLVQLNKLAPDSNSEAPGPPLMDWETTSAGVQTPEEQTSAGGEADMSGSRHVSVHVLRSSN